MIYVVKNNTGKLNLCQNHRERKAGQNISPGFDYRIFEAEYFQKFLCGKKNHTGNLGKLSFKIKHAIILA